MPEDAAISDAPNEPIGEVKGRFRPLDVLVIVFAGLLAGLAYLITHPVSLAPGIQYRLFAFIAPGLGIVLGKYRGGVAAAIGEGVWALIFTYVMGIPMLSIATPFALVGNFFQAFIPGLMIERLGQMHGRTVSVRNFGVMLLGAVIGLAFLSLFWFGVFFEILGVAPYIVIVELLWYSDFLPMLIGVAPFSWVMMRMPGIQREWARRW